MTSPGELDEPEFSLQSFGREGLIEPPGQGPAVHDGTGRVTLSFTV